MYPTDVERSDERIAFKVKRCPLKDAWVEAGVGDQKLATLCRIAGAFDRGLFEATGVRFDNVTRDAGPWPRLLSHRVDEPGCRLDAAWSAGRENVDFRSGLFAGRTQFGLRFAIGDDVGNVAQGADALEAGAAELVVGHHQDRRQ
jgi:hypothetical protein